jgi:hypothetical protein
VTVIELGAVATELTDHITDEATKQATEDFYQRLAIQSLRRGRRDRICRHTRPRRVTLNEILLRPTAQLG